MTCYSVQPRDRIFIKGYGFLSFAKTMGKYIGKNINKMLSNKYSQKLSDYAKQSAKKWAIHKAKEATSDLIGNKIANKITRVSGSSPQNSWETIESKSENTRFSREIPKEI